MLQSTCDIAIPANHKHKHQPIDYIHVTTKDNIDSNKDTLRSNEKGSKELTELEEISARIATLVDILHEKGLIDKKVYERTLAMRLHEISKATVFAEMSD